ncbi:DUF3040 domain-containing protein [Microbacterium sp. No. 7]|uniref:DUF3040 domain-containing protein n=1 Tax=Microbacterium sp. No. 7 TaxID=1714373 RepID=UPI0006D10E5B|nr:DUF3040 domain-containing protein [Microbacterium sp. No. 7]ALJ20818.1 hypothetical protein AOA12_13265 [Microbacterium sp. No. 7]
MPLSEQEQRLLDEMERHLMSNDADVVSAPREGQGLSYRNLVLGAVLVLAGVAALIVGVSQGLTIVGVAAFLVMVGGVVLALTPARGGAQLSSPRRHGGSAGRADGSSFMDRMNDRWDRRQQGG